MPDALHVAKTGLNAQQQRMSVISNNLANVNTVGFKRDRANFETLLYPLNHYVEWHPKLSHFEENLHPNLSHPNRQFALDCQCSNSLREMG